MNVSAMENELRSSGGSDVEEKETSERFEGTSALRFHSAWNNKFTRAGKRGG
jgi:hypothetical protein